MTQIHELKHTADLLKLVEQDCGEGKRSGHWTLYRCPFHEDHTPSMGVKNSDDKFPAFYKCFSCGASGDVFSYLTKKRGLTFADAIRFLGGTPDQNAAPRPEVPPEAKEAPAEDWQASATEVVHVCRRLLWSDAGEKARAWLNARGLQDNTLRTWNIGYSTGMKISGLWVQAGIVIPCWAHNRWWYIKVRRAQGEPKYIKVKGSSGAALFGLNFPWAPEAFRVEGEFDQMLLWQECRDFTNVFTLGSATDKLDPATWGVDLLEFETILDAGDTDTAGNKASADLFALTSRVRRCDLPAHDITDFWKAGGDLKSWAWYQIRKAQIGAAA